MPSTESTLNTIISLAKEIRETSSNINRRSASLADCLGGCNPECGKNEAPESNDLHSLLQRTLSILHETQGEIHRAESIVGIASTCEPIAKQVPYAGGVQSQRY